MSPLLGSVDRLTEHEPIRLTDRARETFVSTLAKPPRANDRLLRIAERYAHQVTSRP